MSSADHYIKELNLEPHPEGGFFRETYRSTGSISASGLKNFIGSRSFSTCIYYLLKGNEISVFHKLKSDEVWHFYDGGSIRIYILSDGPLMQKTLGKEIGNGENFQQVIPANTWFAAELIDKKSFTLAGCTVAPGFDFRDFEIGKREELLKLYPQHEEMILKFTRD